MLEKNKRSKIPVLAPDLEVSTMFLAPLSINHLATSKPMPPRPPVKLQGLNEIKLD